MTMRSLKNFLVTVFCCTVYGAALTWLLVAIATQSKEPVVRVSAAVSAIQADRLALDLRAAKLCREIHGEAGYTWKETGELVCLPRKGGRP